jgi:hypothetical protein
VANTLAYYDTTTITAVKSFIVQAPGATKGGSCRLWMKMSVDDLTPRKLIDTVDELAVNELAVDELTVDEIAIDE